MSVNRVDKHQKEEIQKAYDKIRHIISPSFDTYGEQIKLILEQLYLGGASWGEQDAYSDASVEIKQLTEEVRNLQEDLRSSSQRGDW